jgi:hypothetical protein
VDEKWKSDLGRCDIHSGDLDPARGAGGRRGSGFLGGFSHNDSEWCAGCVYVDVLILKELLMQLHILVSGSTLNFIPTSKR